MVTVSFSQSEEGRDIQREGERRERLGGEMRVRERKLREGGREREREICWERVKNQAKRERDKR